MEKTVICPPKRLGIFNFKELWEYRELLYFLTWRNLKVRYSQTMVGVLWVVIQPVLTMLIFSILFGRFARLPSEGFPYTIFAFSALLPWNLFANSLTGASTSLVNNRNLISKVYFPRIIIPIARVLENLVDFCVSCFILFILMGLYGILPTKSIIIAPFFILWVVMLTLGAGFWLSALNVKYKDVTYAVPFLMQIWLYASPVAYAFSLIPKKWHWLYSLNPMVCVIEGFRWSILGKDIDLAAIFPLSLTITFIIFITGLVYFTSTENTFADII